MTIALLLAILAFPARELHAQEKLLPVLHFECLAEKQGLSNDIRSNIIRDKQGYVWVEYGTGPTYLYHIPSRYLSRLTEAVPHDE